MTQPPPISQSLIKSVRKYQKGHLCGLVLEAEWIHGMRMPTGPAARAGQVFEHWATGQKNYHGEIPKPDYLAAGPKDRGRAKATANKIVKHGGPHLGSRLEMVERWKLMKAEEKGDLTEEYKRIQVQAEAFKAYIKEYKWEIIEVGGKHLNQELQMSASTDLVIRIPKNGYWPFAKTEDPTYKKWSAEKAIVNQDLKLSGLINAKWTEDAWCMDTIRKSDHMLQPVQYAIVTGLKGFLFMVFSPAKDQDCMLIPVTVYQGEEDDHMQVVEETRNQLKSAMRGGFSPHASFQNCKDCPLAEGCKYRVTVPQAEEVIHLSGSLM